MTTNHKPPHEADVSPGELEQRLALLEGVAIFSTLPDRDLRGLARKLHQRHVAAGTEIVRQGEEGGRAYVIVNGRCEVRATWAPGDSITVSLLTAGDFFGIGAMEAGAGQPASVTAIEPTELLELLTVDIDAVLGTVPAARANMEKLVEQRGRAVEHVVGQANTVAPAHESRVIAVYSAKGGSGKTTLAVNIAAALAQRHRGECVLLDLGLPYNHAALTANLVPSASLAMHERASDEELEEMLLSACIHHPIGMMVLPGALRVEQSELITPELVQRAISVLARTFSYIVVDLGVAMSEVTLTVLEDASQIIVIVTPELTAMKDTKELIEVFQNVLNIPDGKFKLVLNRPRNSSMVERGDVERSIGRRLDFELEHDGLRCDRAAVTGELLIVGAPTSPLAKKVKSLAAAVESHHHTSATTKDSPMIRVAR